MASPRRMSNASFSSTIIRTLIELIFLVCNDLQSIRVLFGRKHEYTVFKENLPRNDNFLFSAVRIL